MSLGVRFAYNAGSNGFYNVIDINRGISPDPACRYWVEIPNEQNRFTVNGSRIANNNGCKIIRGILIINLVSKSEADAFRTFLLESLRFIRPFIIEPFGFDAYNLGMGIDTGLLRCYIDGETDTENIIIPYGKGNKYTLRIPYICLDLVTIEGAFP